MESRRRATYIVLVSIIIATLPCYCLGFVLLSTLSGRSGAGEKTTLPLSTLTTNITITLTISGTPPTATGPAFLSPTPPQYFPTTYIPPATLKPTWFPTATPYVITSTPLPTATPIPIIYTSTPWPTVPSSTPLPTETPIPTSTPIPTDTPTEPPTDTPTLTPTETPTELPTPTAEEGL